MSACVPPNSIEAEQSTLGSMMIETSAMLEGLEILHPEDFYRPAHQQVFEALSRISSRNEPCDLITLQEELRAAGKLEDCGGTAYLMALVDAVPTAARLKHYAEIVREKSDLRKIIAAGMEIVAAAQAEEPDVKDRFVQRAINLSSGNGTRIRKMDEVLHVVHDRIKQYQSGKPKMGIKFGIPHLDNVSRGALNAEFTLVAGRPSEGKTCLLTQLAVQAAIANVPTLMFSQEMTAEDIAERAVFMRARVDGEKARDGKLAEEDWDLINERSAELYETPWWTSDLPATINQVVAETKRYILKHKVQLVLIDYLQIIQCPGRFENRNMQVQYITEQLKALAMTHRIPVVAATQLSRAPSKRADPEPTLEDLREGGNQEAAADKIVLIYNPHRRECDEVIGVPSCLARLIVAKNKNGKIGPCTTRWIPQWTRFEDTEEDWVPPAKGAKPWGKL